MTADTFSSATTGQRRQATAPVPRVALVGAHGQAIIVDPASRLVVVQTAAYKLPAAPIGEMFALWRGVVAALGS